MTCNKNEKQQGVKNDAELWTKLTSTTLKTFEETIRRGRNRSIKANLVTNDDADNDYEVSLRNEPHALNFSRYSVYLKSSQTKCLLRERSFLNARCQNSEINDIIEKETKTIV
jgi:hypothetical protein